MATKSLSAWTVAASIAMFAVVGALGGCSPNEDRADHNTEPDVRATTTDTSYSVPKIEEVVDVGGLKTPQIYDLAVARAIADNELWWSEEFPTLYGAPYTPFEGNIYASYPERSEPIPGCLDDGSTDHDDVASFIAFYCSERDFLVYDDSDTSKLTSLAANYGPAVIAMVISHEWAHAIQNRAGIFQQGLPTVVTEQQADCVAGAWVARVGHGESDLIHFDERDIAASFEAISESSDPVGSSQFDRNGHGVAFDRLGAFQVGFDEGLARCAELIDDPLPLAQNEFMPNTGDAETGGEAPLACDTTDQECSAAPDFFVRDLNQYWSESSVDFPTVRVFFEESDAARDVDDGECESLVSVSISESVSVCADEGIVWVDMTVARDDHDRIGDFSLGYGLGAAYAEIALASASSELDGSERALARDCLVGQWIGDITPDGSGRTRRGVAILSPGDLDEATTAMLDVADTSLADDSHGTAVEKVGALRAGIYDRDCSRFLDTRVEVNNNG